MYYILDFGFSVCYLEPLKLTGCYIGGKESNKHESQKLKTGRGIVGKTAVLGMRTRAGKVLARVIPDTSRDTVHQILNKYLRRDSVLATDEHASYKESQ